MARTAERTLSVVLDPHDDLHTLNRLRRLHARPFGQVVCEPAPTGGPSGLARSILAALGKDADLGPLAIHCGGSSMCTCAPNAPVT